MRKGFALNWVVTNDGRAGLFGPRDLETIREAGSAVVRFELRLGAVADWTPELIRRYQGVASQLRGAGIEPIGLVYADAVPGATQPAWNAGNSETGGGTGENPFVAQFAEIAGRLAAAIPEITIWELWNEPNSWRRQDGNAFTGGSFIYPSNFAALLHRASAAIRAVNPACTIVTGGVLSHNNHGVLNTANSGADYLQRVYSSLRQFGGSIPFDAIGQHLYVDQPGRADAGHLWQYVSHMQAIAQRNEGGSGRPIYITEAAWSTGAVSPELQAANLRTLFDVCGRDERIAALCWFQVRDNPPGRQFFGLCAPDWSRKPAFAVFQTL